MGIAQLNIQDPESARAALAAAIVRLHQIAQASSDEFREEVRVLADTTEESLEWLEDEHAALHRLGAKTRSRHHKTPRLPSAELKEEVKVLAKTTEENLKWLEDEQKMLKAVQERNGEDIRNQEGWNFKVRERLEEQMAALGERVNAMEEKIDQKFAQMEALIHALVGQSNNIARLTWPPPRGPAGRTETICHETLAISGRIEEFADPSPSEQCNRPLYMTKNLWVHIMEAATDSVIHK
ncbi:hypothetical protein B0T20DRAFT_477873 [Sordaria brevicollis]|uniref:Uncharacterized protein n=1 Tax=Sordaria brevicollis TaxID=83679 RepID=A0AAE0PHJ2_SORBR|nr:hypothetical protein B0T20DRAFT_477873 [Sordaria brevicollis]